MNASPKFLIFGTYKLHNAENEMMLITPILTLMQMRQHKQGEIF